jgi:Right handed beta helix region
MTRSRRTLGAVCAFALLLVAGPLAAVAGAQASRTWVSGVGDDANPCSRTAACKTLAGAISKTAPGGEIDGLDPGGYGAVTVTKAITIDFSAVGSGGVLIGGTNGIVVNAAGTDDVILRDLDIQGFGPGSGGCPYGGLAGVLVTGARTVGIENSTITSQTRGVQIVPAGADVDVTINRTDISNNCQYGIQVAPTGGHAARVTVRDSTITNSGTAISAGDGAHVWLTGTTIFDNTIGLETLGGGLIDAFGDNQIFGNTSDGVTPRSAGPSLVGPVGATGPAGPAGPQGPAGRVTYRLLVVLPKKSISVRSGQGLSLPYVSTSAADATLQVRHGTKLVASVHKRAKLGSNTIYWSTRKGKKPAAPGRYKLTLQTVSADGQTGSATASLHLTKR